MREIVSVKETTIAFVIFFSTIIILVQMKLIRRLRRIRKMRGEKLEGTLHREAAEFACSALEICCCCMYGAGGGGGGEASISEEAAQAKEKRERREREKRTEPSKKYKRKYKAYQELLKKETSRVTELIAGKEKASIWWLVFTSKVPKFRVIEIIEKDPNYVIKEEEVYNIGELSEEM
jgi:hypothetical protein